MALVTLQINTKDQYELAKRIETGILYPCSDRLLDLSGRTYLIRSIAPLIGAFYGSVHFIDMICNMFEAVIKGSLNLSIGALSLNGRLITTGIFQCLAGGAYLAGCIPAAIFNGLVVSINLLIDPVQGARTYHQSLRDRQSLLRHLEYLDGGPLPPSGFSFRTVLVFFRC
jgi:hypothetical protein